MGGSAKDAAVTVTRPVADPHTYVVRVYSALAILSLTVFGLLNILVNHSATVGFVEVLGGCLALINVLVLTVTHNALLATRILLLLMLGYLGVMLITGGTHNTGIFWFFVFPIAAYFLTSRREGAWWSAGVVGVSVIIWALAATDAITIPYDATTVRQLLISFLVASGGLYAYEYARERLISQTQESRRELHSERVRADVIVQNIDDGVVTTDAKGMVTFANEAVERLLGWKLDELEGKSFTHTVPMLDNAGGIMPEQARPLWQALHNSRPVARLAVYRRKDGRAISVAVSVRPVIVDGKVAGGISSFRDITEEQRVARAKSEFVTLASHQLRTPISAIGWLTELLLGDDNARLSSDQRDHIEGIRESNQRLVEMVDAMLTISSLELGNLPRRPKPVAVTDLAHHILEKTRHALGADQLNVHEKYDPGLPQLLLDPKLLELVVRNIIENAIKYTPAKGNVHITVMPTAPAPPGSADAGRSNVLIEVADDGYGIPESQQSKVFTKFFRAENIKTRDTDGTGLGLYIAKAVAEYAGWRLWFTSKEDKGTTFSLLIPMAPATAPAASVEQQGTVHARPPNVHK
ncbi:MAG TPA: PAS domain-containing sensor histidine kinase [Candidatus Saccharimonadales bacterium]|nr:PAS domain-containing sensor histidine kinase [Candidatus Saccharimonadales bacterium]